MDVLRWMNGCASWKIHGSVLWKSTSKLLTSVWRINCTTNIRKCYLKMKDRPSLVKSLLFRSNQNIFRIKNSSSVLSRFFQSLARDNMYNGILYSVMLSDGKSFWVVLDSFNIAYREDRFYTKNMQANILGSLTWKVSE